MAEQALVEILERKFNEFTEKVRGLMEETIAHIMTKVNENAECIQSISERVKKLEEFLGDKVAVSNLARHQNLEPTEPTDCTRRSNFNASRRSLRLWPVQANKKSDLKQAAINFMKRILKVPNDFVTKEIIKVEMIQPIKNSACPDEVRVQFDEISTRDLVASHAKNLARFPPKNGRPQYGLRIDIPGFLSGDFRSLERFGALMRRQHGTGTRRCIRFDDTKMRLFMDIKIPDCTNWMKVSPELASELLAEDDLRYVDEIKAKLLMPPTTR
jgi:hypothetical protein